MFALFFIFFLILVAIFADFIANDRPIIFKNQSGIQLPIFQAYGEALHLREKSLEKNDQDYWKKQDYQWAIWPWVRFSPDYLDPHNAKFVAPGDEKLTWGSKWRHYLGTDELGRDVLSGLIHGCRISLFVGIFAMMIASFIGTIVGSIAGFWADDKVKIPILQLLFILMGIFLSLFWIFQSRIHLSSDAFEQSSFQGFTEVIKSVLIFVFTILIFNWIGKKISLKFKKKVAIPFDLVFSRLMEIMVSIPTLILVLAIAALAKPSIITLILVIGFTAWVSIARFIRAELIRINQMNYIEAAKVIGLSDFKILWKHSLPNALTPVIITIAFGIAGAILVESTLSFLGIGVPAETMTWGKMLEMARKKSSAWWMAVFPGLMIFLTVTALNLIGDGISQAMNVRNK